jgi:class 3 adenylate cyclase
MAEREHRLAAIMYTDIVGFSRMMEQNEEATLKLLDFHNELIGKLVGSHQGSIIKTIGDAFLISFSAAQNAAKCAIQVQHELAAYNTSRRTAGSIAHPESELLLRIGIHLGDIYFFEHDALGEGINIAARLQALCKPGRICISGEVYNQIANKIDIRMKPMGKVQLKNITRDISAYEIVTESSMEGYEEGKSKDEEDPPRSSFQDPSPKEVPLPPPSFSGEMTRQSGKRTTSYEEPVEVTEFRNYILNQIKRNVDVDKLKKMIPVTDEAIERFSAHVARHIEIDRHGRERDRNRKQQKRYEKWGRKWGFQEEEKLSYFEAYKTKVMRSSEKSSKGFISHISSYIGVISFLLLINLLTSPSYLWVLFPAGGWGIGLFINFMMSLDSKRQRKEVEKIETMDDQGTELLIAYQKRRRGFLGHLSSVLSVSGFLFLVNMITSGPGSYPWFLFPTAALGLSLFLNWISYAPSIGRMRRELRNRKGTAANPRREETKETRPKPAILMMAEDQRVKIMTELKGLDAGQIHIGDDMIPLLDNYMKQIENLAYKEEAVEDALKGFPLDELEEDKKKLVLRIEEAKSEALRQEYQKAIAQIEKQVRSYEEIREQKEMLHVKLHSSLTSLKQLHLDITKMKNLASPDEATSIASIKAKSEELSQYIADLESGYKELED